MSFQRSNIVINKIFKKSKRMVIEIPDWKDGEFTVPFSVFPNEVTSSISEYNFLSAIIDLSVDRIEDMKFLNTKVGEFK